MWACFSSPDFTTLTGFWEIIPQIFLSHTISRSGVSVLGAPACHKYLRIKAPSCKTLENDCLGLPAPSLIFTCWYLRQSWKLSKCQPSWCNLIANCQNDIRRPRQRTNAEGKYKVETVTRKAKADENKCSGTFSPLGAVLLEAPKSPFGEGEPGAKSLTTKSKSGICKWLGRSSVEPLFSAKPESASPTQAASCSKCSGESNEPVGENRGKQQHQEQQLLCKFGAAANEIKRSDTPFQI